MRWLVARMVPFMAALVPVVGSAQVYLLRADPPQVTAAGVPWQINGEPVFYAGDYYHRVGPTVFFDGNVMVRVATYRGVPLYTDTTLQPYSVVFLPVGGTLMRPYERKRTGELAGTVGSRAPSFPIQRDVEVSTASGTTGLQTPPLRGSGTEDAVAAPEMPAMGTSGAIAQTQRPATSARGERPRAAATIESIPPPRSNAGVWIEYAGARWHPAGPAVTYSPKRFVPIGAYLGLVVYRDVNDNTGPIYVPSVPDGPLVPYRR